MKGVGTFRVLLRNELLKLFTLKRTYIGFGVFCFVEIAILSLLSLPAAKQAFARLMTNNGLNFDDTYTGLGLALMIIYLTINLLGVLYLALVSGEMVAREVESGTMRMILARPVSRMRVLAVKIVASVIHTFVFIGFVGATSLLVAFLYRGQLGNLLVYAPLEGVFSLFEPREGGWRFLRAVLVMGLGYQVVAGLANMFSCFRMKSATVVIFTVSLIFVDMILRGIPYFDPYRQFFLTHHLSSWVLMFRYVVPWTEILESGCYLATLTMSCWVIGGTYFCARDFKP